MELNVFAAPFTSLFPNFMTNEQLGAVFCPALCSIKSLWKNKGLVYLEAKH